jgi:hypothetical protein
MTEPRATALAEEAQRYLALVDLFRAEGCEPHWRDERLVRRALRLPNERGGTHEHD